MPYVIQWTHRDSRPHSTITLMIHDQLQLCCDINDVMFMTALSGSHDCQCLTCTSDKLSCIMVPPAACGKDLLGACNF